MTGSGGAPEGARNDHQQELQRDEVVALLRGLMTASTHPRDDRWQSRYDSIEEHDARIEKQATQP